MTEHDTTMTEHDTTMTEHDTTTPPPAQPLRTPCAWSTDSAPIAHEVLIAQKIFPNGERVRPLHQPSRGVSSFVDAII
jgi:hypothetical protein